jgi:hypothetical protein
MIKVMELQELHWNSSATPLKSPELKWKRASDLDTETAPMQSLQTAVEP